jgi:hypothetical protein
MLLRIAALIALAAGLAPAAPKNRDWQTGTLLDTADNIYFGRAYSRPVDTTMSYGDPRDGSELHVGGRSTAENFVLDQYVIESEQYVYLVQIMRLKSNKPFALSANTPVKFAVQKKNFWLVDADGAEHQTTIAKMKPKFQPTQ